MSISGMSTSGISISDWVLVVTTLFLGAIAIFSTYLAEIVKQKLFAPKLALKSDRALTYCHQTEWRNQEYPLLKEPVYFFYFQLENKGKSQARSCEVVIEELWIYDATEHPTKYQSFLPMYLGNGVLNINPHRKILIQIGHISSRRYQDDFERRLFIDIPGSHTDSLRFLLDLQYISFRQPNCFVPGKYAIKVSIFSENASPIKSYFQIAWSGKWQPTETDMLQELVIKSVKNP